MRRWDGWNGFLRELSNSGYEHAVFLLDAQRFGVTQARRRMFLLASLEVHPPLEIVGAAGTIRTAAEVLDPPGKHLAKPVYGRSRPLAEATIERIKRGRNGQVKADHNKASGLWDVPFGFERGDDGEVGGNLRSAGSGMVAQLDS